MLIVPKLQMQTVLDRIERRLEVLGLSAERACLAVGLSPSVIRMARVAESRGEVHQFDPETIERLAPILCTTVDWLLREEGPEEVPPEDEETIAMIEQAKRKGRNRSKKSVVVEDVKGDVKVLDGAARVVDGDATIIDKSINISGDADLSGNSLTGGTLPQGADYLLGTLNTAIIEIYREHGREIDPVELGRIAAPRFARILASCKDQAEFPHALEIMKIRLRKEITGSEDGEG